MNSESKIFTEPKKKLLAYPYESILSSQLQANSKPRMENQEEDHLQNKVIENLIQPQSSSMKHFSK